MADDDGGSLTRPSINSQIVSNIDQIAHDGAVSDRTNLHVAVVSHVMFPIKGA